MKRVFAVALVMALGVSALCAGSAVAEPKYAVQLGIGSTRFNGAPSAEIKFDVFTLHAGGMYFPSPWAALIADFSYGLDHDYERSDDEDTSVISMNSSYLDIMAGACKHFTDGGFVYASAGLSIGWAGLDVSDSDREYEIETGAGFVIGAGLQVPIANTFMGYAGFRQRFIPSDFKSENATMSLNSGGFEMTAGVAWAFGG